MLNQQDKSRLAPERRSFSHRGRLRVSSNTNNGVLAPKTNVFSKVATFSVKRINYKHKVLQTSA